LDGQSLKEEEAAVNEIRRSVCLTFWQMFDIVGALIVLYLAFFF
jgi:hypothetical protein